MKNKSIISFFAACLLFFILTHTISHFSFASGSHPPLIPPPPVPPVTACPSNYTGVIQTLDPDHIVRCYGAKGGLGFQTIGLQKTCGPVLCPVEPPHDNLSRGQSCIRKEANGICHPGTGASGFFDATSDPNTCTPNPAVTVNCPPSLPLYIKAIDQNGTPVFTAKLKIQYNDAPPIHTKPKSITILTQNADSFGVVKVVGLFHAGDHFTITPLTEINASDSAHMVGNTLKFFQEEIGTPFSCGGSAQSPCYVRIYQPYTAGSSTDYFFIIVIIILVILFLMYVLR